MAKYSVTFSCDHTDTVHLVGPTKERERKIAWYEEHALCPECFKAQREAERKALEEQRREESEAATANAEAMGLPDLTGSEKQVAWAVTLRQQFMDTVYSNQPTTEGPQVLTYIIDNATKASDWIDNRNENAGVKLQRYKKMLESAPASDAEINAESTVQPVDLKHPGVVEITSTGNVIKACYPRNEAFRTVVISLKLTWNKDLRCYAREIGIRAGSINDRIAELGNKLLLAGFAVKITDIKIRENAISGTYEPECKRWITYYASGDYKGWLCVSWEWGNEDIYRKARALPGSRWNSPNMAVPASSYREVLDFADVLGFKVSPDAQRVIETYRESVEIVTPQAAPEMEQIDKLGEILNTSADILDSLKDD